MQIFIILTFLILNKILLVWYDRVRRLATDPVVMRSSPATVPQDIIIRYAMLVN